VRNLPPTQPYIQGQLSAIAEQLEHERLLIGGSTLQDLLREMWTIPGNRKRVLISIGLMICQQMTGTNAINPYAPQILESLSIKGTATNLFATGIYGIVKMATCAAFPLFAANSLGRRRSLLWTSIAQDTAMFYIGLYVRIDPPATGPRGPARRVCGAGVRVPVRGLLPVRLGPRVLDLCQRDPDRAAAQLGRRDCGRDAVAV
jgi:hypothetical protein